MEAGQQAAGGVGTFLQDRQVNRLLKLENLPTICR